MDKLETALASIEDNAAAIRALNRALNRALGNRPTIKCIWGTQTSSGITFGNVQSDGNTFVLLIAPYSTQKREIRFCGQSLYTLPMPTMFPLPKGNGELLLRATTSPSAVLVFNGVE